MCKRIVYPMRLSILEPRKIIFEGNAKEVILPGEDGEICVLDFHQPFLLGLRSGNIKIKGGWADNVIQDELDEQMPPVVYSADTVKIKYGIAKMTRNDLILIVELYA
ncbi:MAG: hypothetical protein WAX79_02430 [Candidatus Omnitrophota bacterium]